MNGHNVPGGGKLKEEEEEEEEEHVPKQVRKRSSADNVKARTILFPSSAEYREVEGYFMERLSPSEKVRAAAHPL